MKSRIGCFSVRNASVLLFSRYSCKSNKVAFRNFCWRHLRNTRLAPLLSHNKSLLTSGAVSNSTFLWRAVSRSRAKERSLFVKSQTTIMADMKEQLDRLGPLNSLWNRLKKKGVIWARLTQKVPKVPWTSSRGIYWDANWLIANWRIVY